MFHHVLVATDGSTLGNLALPYAADLARHYGSALTLLYVVPPVPEAAYEGAFTYVYNPGKRARQLEEAERIIQDALAQLDFPDTEAVKAVAQGSTIAEVIVSEIRQAHADLVVMSTHGRTGFAHLFQGSIAEAVMHKLDVPVFLVRAPTSRQIVGTEQRESPYGHPFH